jgi:hypothetical protein
MVTREALKVAHESCSFIATTDRQYDDSFGSTGAKIGTALRVRKPNAYTRTTGSRVMAVQDQSEVSQSITVATQDHVDMRFNSVELALSIDDFSKRYIEPAVKVLVSGIEGDYLAACTKATYNVAGTAGTAITTLQVPGDARTKLNRGLAPKDQNRAIQFDSATMAGLVNGVASYFNPSGALSKQFTEGLVARTAMADYYENERIWTMANGSDITVATESSSALGTAAADGSYTTLNFSTTMDFSVQKVGMVFTIAGVYACHPETKAAYPALQQFTIVTVPASNTFTTISPAIYLSGARQNVCKNVGTALAATDFNTQTCVFVGSASTNYPMGLMYHKEAFQFVTADLPLMDDAAKCVRRVQDNLSMRVWQASDIRNDEQLMRIDILYGFAQLRPEWACRMVGAAAS